MKRPHLNLPAMGWNGGFRYDVPGQGIGRMPTMPTNSFDVSASLRRLHRLNQLSRWCRMLAVVVVGLLLVVIGLTVHQFIGQNPHLRNESTRSSSDPQGDIRQNTFELNHRNMKIIDPRHQLHKLSGNLLLINLTQPKNHQELSEFSISEEAPLQAKLYREELPPKSVENEVGDKIYPLGIPILHNRTESLPEYAILKDHEKIPLRDGIDDDFIINPLETLIHYIESPIETTNYSEDYLSLPDIQIFDNHDSFRWVMNNSENFPSGSILPPVQDLPHGFIPRINKTIQKGSIYDLSNINLLDVADNSSQKPDQTNTETHSPQQTRPLPEKQPSLMPLLPTPIPLVTEINQALKSESGRVPINFTMSLNIHKSNNEFQTNLSQALTIEHALDTLYQNDNITSTSTIASTSDSQIQVLLSHQVFSDPSTVTSSRTPITTTIKDTPERSNLVDSSEDFAPPCRDNETESSSGEEPDSSYGIDFAVSHLMTDDPQGSRIPATIYKEIFPDGGVPDAREHILLVEASPNLVTELTSPQGQFTSDGEEQGTPDILVGHFDDYTIPIHDGIFPNDIDQQPMLETGEEFEDHPNSFENTVLESSLDAGVNYTWMVVLERDQSNAVKNGHAIPPYLHFMTSDENFRNISSISDQYLFPKEEKLNLASQPPLNLPFSDQLKTETFSDFQFGDKLPSRAVDSIFGEFRKSHQLPPRAMHSFPSASIRTSTPPSSTLIPRFLLNIDDDKTQLNITQDEQENHTNRLSVWSFPRGGGRFTEGPPVLGKFRRDQKITHLTKDDFHLPGAKGNSAQKREATIPSPVNYSPSSFVTQEFPLRVDLNHLRPNQNRA